MMVFYREKLFAYVHKYHTAAHSTTRNQIKVFLSADKIDFDFATCDLAINDRFARFSFWHSTKEPGRRKTRQRSAIKPRFTRIRRNNCLDERLTMITKRFCLRFGYNKVGNKMLPLSLTIFFAQ